MLAQRTGAARLFTTAAQALCEAHVRERRWASLETLATKWVECAPDDAAAQGFLRTAREALSPAPRVREPVVEAAIVAPPVAIAAPAKVTPARSRARRWLIAAAAAAVALFVVSRGGVVASPSLVSAETITAASPEALALYRRASSGSAAGITRADAVRLTEQAIALDSSFAMAYRQLGLLLESDDTQRARVTAALTRAAALADRVTPLERAQIQSSYHMLVSGDYGRAAAAQREFLRLEPASGDAWHELGMTYQYLGDNVRAADAYRAALARDSSSAATWFNLIDVVYAAGDTSGAFRALEEMGRAIPGHPGIFTMTATLAVAVGDFARAEQQMRAYLASSPDNPRTQAHGEMRLARILWGAGRLDAGDAAVERGIRWQLQRGDSVGALREGLALAMAATWLRGDPARSARLVRAALARVPMDALPALNRPYVELATAQALAGDAGAAATTLAAYTREVPVEARRRQAGGEALARGTLALLSRDASAATLLEQASTPDCPGCGLPELGLTFDLRGDDANARAAYRRYLELPTLRRTDLLDALHRAWIERRLAGERRTSWPAPPEGPAPRARVITTTTLHE